MLAALEIERFCRGRYRPVWLPRLAFGGDRWSDRQSHWRGHQEDMIQLMKKNIGDRKLRNVELVLGAPTDPDYRQTPGSDLDGRRLPRIFRACRDDGTHPECSQTQWPRCAREFRGSTFRFGQQ